MNYDDSINTIIEAHQLWLSSNGEKGRQLDLSRKDLRKARFEATNFQEADFTCADMAKANLSIVDICGANLTGIHSNKDTRWTRADLSRADLKRAITERNDPRAYLDNHSRRPRSR